MWLVYDVTHVSCGSFIMWLVYDVTHVWCDSFIMWLVHDVPRLWCDSFMMQLIRDVTHLWCDSFMMWLIYDVTHLWCDSFMMWLTYVWRNAFSRVWNDPFISGICHGMATISRLLKNIGLFWQKSPIKESVSCNMMYTSTMLKRHDRRTQAPCQRDTIDVHSRQVMSERRNRHT